jgi:adenylosuccinate synthase
MTFFDLPPLQWVFHDASAFYEELVGWLVYIDVCQSFDDLPKQAQAYVRRMEALVGVPVGVVSVGPAREQSLPAT